MADGTGSPRMSTSPFCRRSSARDRLLADLEDDLVELGVALVVVAFVPREDEALAQGPLGEAEGAGADRVLAEVLAMLLDGLLRHGMGEVERHDVEEGGVGAREGEADGAVVDHLDAGEALGVTSRHLVEARDHAEEPSTRALRLGADDAVDRVLDVVGHQLAAVVEGDALLEREGVGEAVLADLVALGQVRNEIGGAGLVVHQAVEQALDHRPVLPVVADGRIERADIVLVGDDHRAALLDVLGMDGAGGEHEADRGGRG